MTTGSQRMEAEENAEEQFDAGDENQVREARKRETAKERRRREALERTMATKDGRTLVFGGMAAVFDLQSPVAPGDPYSTYFNMGKYEQARASFNEVVRLTPELFTQMVIENLDL